MKKFDIAILEGRCTTNLFVRLVANIIPGISNLIKKDSDPNYKTHAIEYLNQAKEILIKELEYCEIFFNSEDIQKLICKTDKEGNKNNNIMLNHVKS